MEAGFHTNLEMITFRKCGVFDVGVKFVKKSKSRQ